MQQNENHELVNKVKVQGLDRPLGLQELEAPKISRHSTFEVVSPMYRPPLPPSGVDPEGPSAAERIKSVKNSKDPTGKRTRNLPACNAVSQPTAPRRARTSKLYQTKGGQGLVQKLRQVT